MFHTRAEPLIDTGALARCQDALTNRELFQFQQFIARAGELLRWWGAFLRRCRVPEKMFSCPLL
jgi:hypothetical protein